MPKAYDTGECQISRCSKIAGVYDHCHIHGWVRGAICVDCNLSMGRFDAAMMHNSFYMVPKFELAKKDLFVLDYYQHWLKCPDCAASIQGDEEWVLDACQQVFKWQSQFRKSLARGYGGKEISYRYDLNLEYLWPRILPGTRPHPPVRCYACCDGCAISRFALQIWPEDRKAGFTKGFTVDKLRKSKPRSFVASPQTPSTDT